MSTLCINANRKPFPVQILCLLLIFSPLLTAAVIYPPGDLDRNYAVNMDDLLIFADQWLDESGCVPPDCAELDSIDGVTMSDFSVISDNWLEDYHLPLAINEFMASNSSTGGDADPQGEYDDWIEIYNFGETAIDLAGLFLSDDPDEPTRWRFPADRPGETVVQPGGFAVIWADEDVGDMPGLHAGFQLSSDGEAIGLFDADGTTLIDSVSFGEQLANVSYGRWPDGADDLRYFATATAGGPNSDAYTDLVEDTKFSHDRGFYEAPFDLIISSGTPGAAIYYTTDGSAPIENEMPTPTSVLYTGPITIGSNACIRAGAVKTGWMPTNIDTHTYIFDAGHEIQAMPVVCLVGDPDTTFWGPDGIMSHFTERGIAYERPVSFEIIDMNQGVSLQEDCGIRIHGSDHTRPGYTVGDDWSTCWVNWWPGNNSNKIGFNLWFRNDYGNNRLEYPFFPFIDVEQFKSIVLRQGKNDACTPFVKDEWARRLFREMGRAQVTGTFANLYLNGAYKSYYNPTARGDEEFYQAWYGTENSFDVITQSGVRNGDAAAWNDLLAYVDSHDLSNTADYAYVAGQFDIPTFIDFLIVEIHIANFDWPNNNWDVHRERSEDGKFRYSIWDAEGLAETWEVQNNWGKNAFTDFPSYVTEETGLNAGPWPICRIYRGLVANPEFRQLFADQIHRHYRNGGIMTESHLLEKWWEVFNEVSGVLPETQHFPVRFVPDEFLPRREPLILQVFEENNLFDTNFGYPVFNVNGSYRHGGSISSADTVTISQSDPSGTLYYTTDGSDPRTPSSVEVIGEGFLLAENAPKKVLVPAGEIGTAWRGGSEPYDDSGWVSGAGGVGYERSSGYEDYIDIDTESAMYNRNSSCYIRIPFTIDGGELPTYDKMILRIRYDDGFAAYLNGTEVQRVNFSGTPQWNSPADRDHEADAGWSSFDISAHLGHLRPGNNLLAVHGLNKSTTSSDFLICAELEIPAPVIEIEGGLAPGAIQYTGGFHLAQSSHLKSRILGSAGQWSVLTEAVYGVGPVAESLRISELMYHPPDPNDEFIELVNIGAEPINLNLVRLTKGVDYDFGADILDAGERVLLVRNQGSFLARYPGFSGRILGAYEGSLDNGGEKIRLRDARDAVIQEFSYRDGWYEITDGDGFSLTVRDVFSRDPNDWDTKEGWRPSAVSGGSPGGDDTGLLPEPGAVVINEVLAHSHATAPDWIELHNTTGEPIHIGGWFLSDSSIDDPNITKYEIPAGTAIPAGGYAVFYEDQHFGNAQAEGVHVPFALSEGGETVYLRSGAEGVIGGYAVCESFGASAAGIAFGRHIKSTLDGGVNFVAMSENTPGEENSYPLVGPVVISEIMYHPGAANTGGEYLELHNITDAPVTLQDSVSTETSPGVFQTDTVAWQFSDGIDFVFPAHTTLPAYGYLIIAGNPAAFSSYYGAMPPGVSVLGPFQNETALSNGGERLQIVRPGDQEYGQARYWIRTERVTYDDAHPWPESADGDGNALHQKSPDTAGANYGNDAINWQGAAPGPGA